MAKIGIDLGTTFSCVAVYRNGKVEVLANPQGKRTTPSIVSFKENERLIGEEAKQQMGINPKNTVYGIKRLIGRKFNDETVTEDIKRWPFEVTKDPYERPNIKVEYQHKTFYFQPEEISAMILERMKLIAEQYLGTEVDGAVITVPAYFNDGQRQATKQAAEIAKLNVLRIINEPTAAAIAYGLQNKMECDVDQQKVVIFDFGGGTLDVTVLVIEDGVFDVKSTKGDTHLGGEDFDNKLVDFCLTELEKKFKNQNLRDNKKILIKLKAHCEQAKMNLCNATSTIINIDALVGESDFTLTISRDKFDRLTKDLMDKVMLPVTDALKEAHFDPSDIHNVVLVGGSTKLARIQEKLKEFFTKSQLNMGINPDEAVAMGAAIQAAKLSGVETSEELRELVLMDVTPLSLGIQIAGGNMAVIIPRNTTVPVTRNKTFTTNANNQTVVTIKIFEGERPQTINNHYLGELKLTGITSAAAGLVKIDVSFHIDSDGVLSCTGVEQHEGRKPKEVRIQSKAGLLTKEDIERMIENAKQFRLKDQEEKERIDAKSNLESLCYRLSSSMQNAENYGKDVDLRNKVIEICGVTLSWLSDNTNLSKEEYEKKYKEVHDECDPIRRKLLNVRADKSDNKDHLKHDSVDQ